MITIYSDGGADNKANSGAACVIEDINSEFNLFVACLGDATNNEGEIFSAIMGFSIVRILSPETKNVKWVSDSEYSLKSLTQYSKNWVKNGWKTSQNKPVKNQGLWKTFLSLTKDIKIYTEHVKGHSGHLQNEACDTAVAWIRNYQEEFKEGLNIIETEAGSKWLVIDARSILNKIRKEEVTGLEPKELLKFFQAYTKSKSRKNVLDKENNEVDNKVRKLTNAYLAKLDQIDTEKQVLKQNPKFAESINILRKWLADS